MPHKIVWFILIFVLTSAQFNLLASIILNVGLMGETHDIYFGQKQDKFKVGNFKKELNDLNQKIKSGSLKKNSIENVIRNQREMLSQMRRGGLLENINIKIKKIINGSQHYVYFVEKNIFVSR